MSNQRTLTSAIETLTGTAGNDTFIAGVSGANQDTLNLGDVMDLYAGE